jgi:hypothetical protein
MSFKELVKIHYVPYIHKQLMNYLENNTFLPKFIEEPLNRKV